MKESYDPDRIRFSSSEEGFNPGYVLGTFKELLTNLKDITDVIFKSNAIRMSKERYTSSQDFLKAYEKTMLAYRDVEPIGKLTTEQQRQILVMVNDVLAGKRECVQFQLNRGCNGIKEIFSNRNFEFQDKQQDKK
jgi:hypothetical protein